MSKKAHDRKVRQLANNLKKQGFEVKADIDGFETPDGIGKADHVPDIFATKGQKTKIVEVDTPGTENPDQLAAFKRSAAHRKNADFEHVITKPRK
jgi:Holliday junction resolvase